VQESQSQRRSSIPVAPHSTKRKSFKAEPSARKKRQSKPPNKRTSSLSDGTPNAATPDITASHYGGLSVLHDPPERSVNTILVAPKIVHVSGKSVPCMRWRSHVMLNISNIRRESRGTSQITPSKDGLHAKVMSIFSFIFYRIGCRHQCGLV